MQESSLYAASWVQFADQAPTFSVRVLERLAAHPHHVLATIAADGSPRVAGTNVFCTTEEPQIRMMPRSARIAGLPRDGRCSPHSAPLDETLTGGDVRSRLVARELERARAAALLTEGVHPENGGMFALSLRESTGAYYSPCSSGWMVPLPRCLLG